MFRRIKSRISCQLGVMRALERVVISTELRRRLELLAKFITSSSGRRRYYYPIRFEKEEKAETLQRSLSFWTIRCAATMKNIKQFVTLKPIPGYISLNHSKNSRSSTG